MALAHNIFSDSVKTWRKTPSNSVPSNWLVLRRWGRGSISWVMILSSRALTNRDLEYWVTTRRWQSSREKYLSSFIYDNWQSGRTGISTSPFNWHLFFFFFLSSNNYILFYQAESIKTWGAEWRVVAMRMNWIDDQIILLIFLCLAPLLLAHFASQWNDLKEFL